MSPAAATKRVDDLEIHAVTFPLNGAVGQAYKAVAAAERPRREVYILSDLARSAWEPDRPIENLKKAREAKPEVATYVMRLTAKDPRNAGLIDAEARPAAGVATQGAGRRDPRRRCDRPGPRREADRRVLPGRREGRHQARPEGDRPARRRRGRGPLPHPQAPRRPASRPAEAHRGRRPPGLRRRALPDLPRPPPMRVPAGRRRPGARRRLRQERARPRGPAQGRAPAVHGRGGRDGRVLRRREGALEGLCLHLPPGRQALDDADWGRLNGYVREGGGLVVAPGRTGRSRELQRRGGLAPPARDARRGEVARGARRHSAAPTSRTPSSGARPRTSTPT